MKYFDFFTESGRINSMKVKETWLKKHDPELLASVNNFIMENNLPEMRFVEKLWYYFNNITQVSICKNTNCNNLTRFKNLKDGYFEYCSTKCSNSSIEVKKSKIESCIKKFGVENPFQSHKIIEKIKETNIKRFGVVNPMQSDKVKNKMINNSIRKNGVPWALSHNGRANITKKENLKRIFEEKYKPFILIRYSDKKFGECEFYSAACSHNFTINKWQLHQRHSQNVEVCTICNPIGSFIETQWQNEIEDLLNYYNIKYYKNNRSVLGKLELDFYLPEFKLAIELNGLYWHSINFKDSEYHINKTELCANQNIQLIHIFEDEWLYKKQIVKSRILNILGLSQTKIYARKCKIMEISGKEARDFIESNHIQGSIPASIRLGLFYENQLVSVMTFGALRRALGSIPSDGEYEMYRFCNKLNYSVVGGASKLLKYFIEVYKPLQIISYADRRWSLGNLYRSLDFTLIKKTVPNFWYIINGRREHRFNWTKKKIAKKQINVNELLRIYDSGNLKFIKYISSPSSIDK